MIFESQNSTRKENIKKTELKNCLMKINGTTNSYAVLERQDGSYIQVGGGPIEFIVEIRKYLEDGDFIHYRASNRNPDSSGAKHLVISGAVVAVQSNQILFLEEVILLFNSYLNDDELSSFVDWVNITEMFL